MRPEMAEPEKLKMVHDAFDLQRQAIEDAGTEAIVMVSSEHFANFFMDNMPTFSIGMADEYEGPIENSDWIHIQKNKVPADPELSLKIIEDVMQTVDVGFAQEWQFDHGMAIPLHFLTPEYKTPIVPVNINCQVSPMPPLHRAWDLGKALRGAIDNAPKRIALISTGGTSHWPCTPDTGKINLEWDKEFIDHIIHTRKDKLLSYDPVTTFAEGGAGAGEMRVSIAVAAACEGELGEVHLFEPIPEFATTCVVVTLFKESSVLASC